MKRSIRTIVLLLIVSLLVATSVGVLSACTGNYDVILVTDKQNIEDGSYTQALYNATEKYCKEHGLTFCGMVPTSKESKEYKKTLKKALENYNAKYVITPSTAYAEVLTEEFTKPYVANGQRFIFVSGVNHYSEYPEYTVPEGVAYINISEAELGYLTGYLAAKVYDNIGFYAGNISAENDTYKLYDSVQNYYDGFVQGVSAVGSKTLYVSTVRTKDGNIDKNKNQIQTDILKKADFVFSVAGDENKSVQAKAVVEKKVAINPDNNYASSEDYSHSIGYVGIDFDGLISYVLNKDNSEALFGKSVKLGAKENAIKVYFDKKEVEASSNNATDNVRAEFAKYYEEAFNATKLYSTTASTDNVTIITVTETVEG